MVSVIVIIAIMVWAYKHSKKHPTKGNGCYPYS